MPPPTVWDGHTLVEYVETLMLVEGVNHLSIAELTSRFPSGRKPQETETANIRSAVLARADALGELYPYRADDEGVERRTDRDTRVYDYLLLLSLEHAPYRRSRDFTRTNRIFDLLVREAIKHFLGSRSEAVRFGTPVQDGRPEDFIAAVSWLAERMGVADGQKDRPADANDAGVDVVAWLHFADRRSGFPVVLAQCTLEMNYVYKSMQIPVLHWQRWIGIGPHPQTTLAVPFTVARGDDRWMLVTGNTAWLFERVRICENLIGVDLTGFPEWKEMGAFIEAEAALVLETEEDDPKRPQPPRRRKQKISDYRDPLRR